MPARRKKKLITFHATMIVTRAEEWCVEAATVEEAQQLLETGQGHRCTGGDALHAEIGELHKSH